MNYIYNETLSWVVDWVNKTFTTQYQISKIEEVYLWGVSYRDVSFVWNVVTFADAPPVWSSPSIDYFESETPTPVSESDVTLWLIIDDVYDKLVQDRVLDWIPNDTYKETQIKKSVVTWFRRIRNKSIHKDKISSYSFRSAKWLTAKSEDNTNIDVWEYDNVPNNWKWMFQSWAVFDYTGYSNWILNSDLATYNSGDRLSVGYKLPSAAIKPSEVLVNWFPLQYKDPREYSLSYKYYTVIDWYIFLPYSENDNIVVVKYIPKYSQLIEDSDLIDIEYDYFEVLSYYALYKVCQLVEDDRWDEFKVEYEELERDYKSYKSKAVDWINNSLRSDVLKWF